MSYSSSDSDDFLRKPKPRRKHVAVAIKPKALLHAKKAKPFYNGSSSDSDDILTLMSRKKSVGSKSTFLSLTSKKEVKLKLDIWGDESSDDQYTAGTPMGSGSGTPTGTATFASYSAAGALGPTSTSSTTSRATSPTSTSRAHSPALEKVSSIPSASAASSSAAPPAAIVTKRPKAIHALPARAVPLESSSYPAVQPSRSAATSGDDDDNETVEYLTPKRSDSPRPEGSASEEELKQDVYKSNPSLPADLQLLIARHQIQYNEPSDKSFKMIGIENEKDILEYVKSHAKELREAGHLDRRGLLIVFGAAPEMQVSPLLEGQGTGLFSAIDIASKSATTAASTAVKPESQSESANSPTPAKAISKEDVKTMYQNATSNLYQAIKPNIDQDVLEVNELVKTSEGVTIDALFTANFKQQAQQLGIDVTSEEYSDALGDALLQVRNDYYMKYFVAYQNEFRQNINAETPVQKAEAALRNSTRANLEQERQDLVNKTKDLEQKAILYAAQSKQDEEDRKKKLSKSNVASRATQAEIDEQAAADAQDAKETASAKKYRLITEVATIDEETFETMTTLAIVEYNQDMFKTMKGYSVSNVIVSLKAMRVQIRKDRDAILVDLRAQDKARKKGDPPVTLRLSASKTKYPVRDIDTEEAENEVPLHRFTVTDAGEIEQTSRSTTVSSYRELASLIKSRIITLRKLQTKTSEAK
jgi:hypothetical protein